MRGDKGDDEWVGGSSKDACFALRVVRWPRLRGDRDLDCEASQGIGVDRFVDGGKEASGVVGTIGEGSNGLASLLRRVLECRYWRGWYLVERRFKIVVFVNPHVAMPVIVLLCGILDLGSR